MSTSSRQQFSASKTLAAGSTDLSLQQPQARLVYRALEQRIVFDAALAATAADAQHHTEAHASTDQHPAPVDNSGHAAMIDALHMVQAGAPQGETFVFVDSRVANYQTIVAHAAPGAATGIASFRTTR